MFVSALSVVARRGGEAMMAVSSLTEPSVPPVPEGGGSDDLMSDFVVLPRSPNDDCFMLEAGTGNGPLDQLKLSLPHDDRASLSSASDDLTHQEAEERIAKVLKENVTLKGFAHSSFFSLVIIAIPHKK